MCRWTGCKQVNKHKNQDYQCQNSYFEHLAECGNMTEIGQPGEMEVWAAVSVSLSTETCCI